MAHSPHVSAKLCNTWVHNGHDLHIDILSWQSPSIDLPHQDGLINNNKYPIHFLYLLLGTFSSLAYYGVYEPNCSCISDCQEDREDLFSDYVCILKNGTKGLLVYHFPHPWVVKMSSFCSNECTVLPMIYEVIHKSFCSITATYWSNWDESNMKNVLVTHFQHSSAVSVCHITHPDLESFFSSSFGPNAIWDWIYGLVFIGLLFFCRIGLVQMCELSPKLKTCNGTYSW